MGNDQQLVMLTVTKVNAWNTTASISDMSDSILPTTISNIMILL